MIYLKRIAETSLARLLASFPVVGITGPRQSGKSTLLINTLTSYRYVTFDNPVNVDQFEDDPHGFMQRFDNKVIFDEVHYVPNIFRMLKLAVDADRKNYGKFVVTCSSQFGALKPISESLAGRLGSLALLPLQYTEIPEALVNTSIYQGGYPELVSRSYLESELWYAAYFDTYLNKDVRLLSNIGDMRDFRRFINLLASRVTQQLDMSDYAKEIGVSSPTIKRWLSILEASYVIFLLPAYYKNFGKRITKRPKVYFYDNGLVSYLTGIKTFEQYDQGPMAGALFENYIVSDIKKRSLHRLNNEELFYLRTSDKQEIDLIIDRKNQQQFIEIKKTTTFRPAMLKTIEKLMPKDSEGCLIYSGESMDYKPGLKILNYQRYLT